MIKFRIRILLLGNWRFELKIEWNLLFVFCFIKLSDTMGSMAQRFFFYLKNWNKIKYNLNDFMLCVLTYIPTSYTLLLYASVIRYFPYTAKRNSIQKKNISQNLYNIHLCATLNFEPINRVLQIPKHGFCHLWRGWYRGIHFIGCSSNTNKWNSLKISQNHSCMFPLYIFYFINLV